MAGWTNKGKFRMMEAYLANGTEPTVFYLALVTSATAPTADTNTFGQLTEIAAGNGYTTGGISLTRNATYFPVSEDDTNDRGNCIITNNGVDPAWTASGGSIPASGGGARYAVMTDDNVTVANREVIAYWDLVSDRTVTTGQTLTLDDPTLRANEA